MFNNATCITLSCECMCVCPFKRCTLISRWRANFPADLVEHLPEDLKCGVYYGWAAVDDGPVHRMVMSVGWNPYYKNEKKSMEAHIMHHFDDDFYGSVLRVAVLGYLRAEKNFASVDDLVAAIKKDIADADSALSGTQFQQYKSHPFFSAEQLSGGAPLVRSA
ncbi:riboflavin kinase-like isoform X1 [Ornithodoros turicata]|uniref:riboflavin kinase-like isoform X1 n=1 Tax=Ornithodoros turicata TaxID=34597 RepID=UPI003138747F